MSVRTYLTCLMKKKPILLGSYEEDMASIKESWLSNTSNVEGLDTLFLSVLMKKTKKVRVKKNQTTKNKGIRTNKTKMGRKRNFQSRGRSCTVRRIAVHQRKRITMEFQDMYCLWH